MMRWLRKPSGESLTVSMPSIKLGDRLLIVGSTDVLLIAALAAKAGLTGRTCMVDEAEAVSTRAAVSVEREGALVESFTSSYAALPFEVGEFDVAIVRNVIGAVAAEKQRQLASEVHRVLRPGGRCIVIEGSGRRGVTAWLGAGDQARRPTADGLEQVLSAAGFRGVRTLAEREGLVFIEGVKAGTG